MLVLQIIILFTLIIFNTGDLTDQEVYEQVGLYLQRARLLRARSGKSESTEWLPNSGKLALGFDPVRGDPICFSGECRANGFNQPIFEMNYAKTPSGFCTNKLIPENVNVIHVLIIIYVYIYDVDFLFYLDELYTSYRSEINN